MAATVRDTDGVLPGVLKDSRGVTENFTNPEQVVTVDEGPSSLVSSPRVKSTSSNKWKSVKSLITAGNALTSSSKNSSGSQRSMNRQSSRRLRESSFKAVKDARGGAAVKSRQSLGFGLASVYFQVLERSWLFCTGVLAGSFFISLGVCALLCYLVQGYECDSDSATAPLRFAASHVFTMGFGTVSPVSDLSYALAVSQCFLGVLLNVFMFTFVITKFQRPLAAMMLAEKICLCTRAGEPFLLVRFANLRCNTLHKADVTLTLLRRRKTPEGESFVARTKLNLHEPPTTLTAFATVAHRVDENGPGAVFRDLQSSSVTAKDVSDLLIQVVVSAYDPIYDKEICAVKVYNASDVAVNSVYAGMMGTDESGAAVVNFESMSQTVAQGVTVFPPSSSNSQAPRLNVKSNKLELILGAGRGILGPSLDTNFPNLGPISPLEQMCGYCAKLVMVLGEGGMEFSSRYADITDDNSKPRWLESINPKKEAPAARLPGTSNWISGTDDIMAALGDQHDGVKEVLSRTRTDVTEADEQLFRSFMWVWISAVCSGPETTIREMVEAKGMGAFMLTTVGLYDKEKDGVDDTVSMTVHEALNNRAKVFLTRLESLLSNSKYSYLSGDAPGKVDFWVFQDVRVLLDECFIVWLEQHGLLVKKHFGPYTKNWLSDLYAKPHVKHSMGAGHSDGVLANVRTIISKCIALSPTPGFPLKNKSIVLMEQLKNAHPPATLWSDMNGGSGDTGDTDDTDESGGVKAIDSAAARLCV